MTVGCRPFPFVVIPVVILRFPRSGTGGRKAGGYVAAFCHQLVDKPFRGSVLCLAVIEDFRAVLPADVRALPIDLFRVMYLKKRRASAS